VTATRASDPWSAVLEPGIEDERLVHRGEEPARPGHSVPLPHDLHPRLAAALREHGVGALWSHQARAWEAVADGPVVVTTGTASGKSLCFNLPALDTLLRDTRARALYLYPTKALAQDQARALAALDLGRAVRPAIYDGDTPRQERAGIRRKANLVLTNPDMLHVGILPHHDAWADVLANLAVVVVDEAHTYRGVFGSHVANVLRRLRRLAAAYGTEPRFVLASATIANPRELAEGLTGLDGFALVDDDGASREAREIVMWNPPLEDEELGTRASALAEAAELFAGLVQAGARTICFMKSRKAVEVIHQTATARLDAALAARVAPYRAGYTPQQRREIEARLAAGDLLGVVATDALELGIDIGSLDAAICVTFPGTVASLRQMWGRAGRRARGLALYVAGEDALDQFFCRHPAEFLERPVEAAILDPESEEIQARHLLCAAHEGPLGTPGDDVLGVRWRERAAGLVSAGLLRERRDGTLVPRRADDYPAAGVSLRSASADAVALADAQSGEMIGTVEAARAPSTVHPGAVYLHLGRAFEVGGLDLERGRAVLSPFDGDWFTQPRRASDTWIEAELERRETMGVLLHHGRVVVEETVTGYQRRRLATHEVVGFEALDLPPSEFATRSLWFELGDLLSREFPAEHVLGALHAVEHAQIAVLPLLAMCDRWDVGGLSTNAHPQTGGPTIFIHDAHPGGIGIARRGYEAFETLVADAYRLIAECRCREGCPSCVQSPKCGNLNEPLSKAGAREVLERMLA